MYYSPLLHGLYLSLLVQQLLLHLGHVLVCFNLQATSPKPALLLQHEVNEVTGWLPPAMQQVCIQQFYMLQGTSGLHSTVRKPVQVWHVLG